jgi:hypothetical protein
MLPQNFTIERFHILAVSEGRTADAFVLFVVRKISEAVLNLVLAK